MDVNVQVGSWYVVEGDAGDTVTNPSTGKVIATVEEGKQTSFLATTPYVVTSADTVGVHKVNFKGASVKLRLLGQLGRGVDALPSGYLRAAFMQNSELGWVDTGLKAHGDTAVECEFVPTVYNWVNFYYSSGGHNSKPVMYGSFDYNKAYGRRFTYGYGNNNLVRLDGYDGKPGYSSTLGQKYTTAQIGGAFYINGEFVYEIAYEEYESNSNLCFFGSPVNGNVGVKNLQMHRAKVSRAGVKQRDFVPAIDPSGVPCFYDKETKQPFYFRAFTEGAVLIAGLTLSQARKLGKLPEGGGEITVSLPWEAQLDKKVDAALSEAKAKGWTIVVQYQEPDTTSAVYNKYAACKTKDDLLAVNPDYMNDLTADGSWVYPLSELGDVWQIFTSASKVKKLYFSAPKMIDSGEICEVNSVEYVELDIPQCTHLRWAVWRCSKVTEIRVNAPNLSIANMFAENCANLRVFEGSLPSLSDAPNMFYGCQLDAHSTISVLNSLPSYSSGTHRICMGIHVDYEADADVAAAVADAEAKGWTVDVQWNGTATAQAASTWGLRRKPVYAKVEELETLDGATERVLAWGHYVTNWEERGYMEFASVEEAKEYFNIGD